MRQVLQIVIACAILVFAACRERVVDTTQNMKVSPAATAPKISPTALPSARAAEEEPSDDPAVEEEILSDPEPAAPEDNARASARDGGRNESAIDPAAGEVEESGPHVPAEQALSDTHKAVNRALDQARGAMVDCMRQAKTAPKEVTVRIRVHSSGRVIESEVLGLKGPQAKCIENVLSGLRVEMVLTDSITVERTFQLQ